MNRLDIGGIGLFALVSSGIACDELEIFSDKEVHPLYYADGKVGINEGALEGYYNLETLAQLALERKEEVNTLNPTEVQQQLLMPWTQVFDSGLRRPNVECVRYISEIDQYFVVSDLGGRIGDSNNIFVCYEPHDAPRSNYGKIPDLFQEYMTVTI